MKRLLPLLLSFAILHAQTPFSSDSAISYLKVISVTIGARPMGSPNERKAMEFGLAKFKEFGLNDIYLMNMSVAKRDLTHPPLNTNSGIAVGVLHGKTNRIIVIGGHIDSAGPDIPGANDDGSGAASVIELARVLSKEQLQSTIVFCLFGGEEAGLCGSNHFVQNFPQLDSVALMLQIDMANGSDILIPTIDDKNGNTPIWLVEAAYEEFGKLGYTGLEYPTHFFTFMGALPAGGVGSDHEPFLEKNIPAIDFTSDINDPIHTPQDDFEHFKPSGLKRSGDLVYALIHRFDNGVPPEKTENYFLFQIGKHALFFPLWLLSAFIIATVVLTIYALFDIRRRRTEIDRSQRPKVPALKLFLFAILIQTCVWLSENLIGLIKGTRFPWIANPEGYFVLGFLAALVGIALSLKLTPFMNLSKDPYRWFLRTVIFLLIFISLMALINVKVMLYPSIGLFFISLAIIVRKSWLKFIFWIVSPHFMFRLMFSEGFIFLARGTALHSMQPLWMYFVLHIFYILFFAIWSFPFLLGFAAVYFDSGSGISWLKQLRTRTALVIITTVFVLCGAILAWLPSYSDQWRQRIIIDQTTDINTGESKTVLKSSEYLKNLNVHFANKDTVISGWDREILLNEFKINSEQWIHIERTMETSSDSGTTFDILTKIRFKYRPEKFLISYSSSNNKLEDVSELFADSRTDHSINMRWESFPDTSLLIPVHFKVLNADSVTETIEARFAELIEPMRIEKELVNIVPRSTLRRTELLRPSAKK
jgi:hypothetical protein